MNKETDIIIGMGEIGKGLYEVIKESGEPIVGLDLNKEKKLEVVGKHRRRNNELPSNIRLMHICIPGGIDNFVKSVIDYIALFKPRATIIHSTVPVGTTSLIGAMGNLVIHSPVRGKHPNMAAGIRAYVKYLGMPKGIDVEDWQLVVRLFNTYGLTVKTLSSPEASEMAKILSTTRYGINLLFADMQQELLDDNNLKYFEVVLEWEKTYNEGLKNVGMEKYSRPLLTPPNGYIGGHCVYENTLLLLNSCKRFRKISIFLKALKYFGRDKKDEK